MAYEKQTWVTGETITAKKLNHMEDGIGGGYDIVFTIDGDEVTADGASFEEFTGNVYKKALVHNCEDNIFYESVRYESYNDEDEDTGDSITVVNFEFIAGGQSQINLQSNGKFSSFLNLGSGTYTYSNGHYVFTLTGGVSPH